jgi:hypothetical protein
MHGSFVVADPKPFPLLLLLCVVQVCVASLCIIVFIVLSIILLAILFSGTDANNWCSFCKYISCVPTPYWSCNAPAIVETAWTCHASPSPSPSPQP